MSLEHSLLPFFIVVAIAVGFLYFRYKKKPRYDDVKIEMPDKLRKDLLFGYYATFPGQVAETQGHISLLWEAFFDGGVNGAIKNILAARCFTVLDVSSAIFERIGKHDYRVRDDAHDRLRQMLQQLHDAGALEYVKVLVPTDEPNLNTSVWELQRAMDIMRSLAADFAELEDVLYGVIYMGRDQPDFPLIEQFDLVGFDYYKRKSSVLSPGALYDQMRKLMRPDARTWLIPGGFLEHPIDPWLAFAMRNEEVFAIVAFLWASVDDGERLHGLRDNPARDSYIAAAQLILAQHD